MVMIAGGQLTVPEPWMTCAEIDGISYMIPIKPYEICKYGWKFVYGVERRAIAGC